MNCLQRAQLCARFGSWIAFIKRRVWTDCVKLSAIHAEHKTTSSQSADGTTSVVQNGVDHPPAAASLMERNVDAPDGLKSLPRGFVLDDTDKWCSDLLDGDDKLDILLLDSEDISCWSTHVLMSAGNVQTRQIEMLWMKPESPSGFTGDNTRKTSFGPITHCQ